MSRAGSAAHRRRPCPASCYPVAITVSEYNPAQGPLAGLRVVECGEGVAAAFAAKLMADLGATVIKVEPPGGDVARRRGPFPGHKPDPERSGLFIYLNSGK